MNIGNKKIPIWLIVLLILIPIPVALIYILFFISVTFSFDKVLCFPLLIIDVSDGLKLSDYIGLYVSIIGIEVTAILTWVIFDFSRLEEKQEKREKELKEIAINRSRVFEDLMNSLEYFYKLHLSDNHSVQRVLDPFILIQEDWKESLLRLDLDKESIRIYQKLYENIHAINNIIRVGKPSIALPNIEEFFREITLECYQYYKGVLGLDISVESILKDNYINALMELNSNFNVSSSKYRNGKPLFTKNGDIYTVYNEAGEKMCSCSFALGKPLTGYAKLYNKDTLYFDGTLQNGKEIEGDYFYCEIDEHYNIKKSGDRIVQFFGHFHEKATTSHSRPITIASVKYADNQYIVNPDSIKSGFYNLI